jgi:DNA-binding LacI/PurR family transcriptional regulator
MTKKPTIKDVAKKAGVSIATVSFVLNKHPNEVISDKVKKRVEAAARSLDYHPSATAAGLARKRTRNVAIIFYRNEKTISNQFYSFVIQGAIQEAIERHYNLLFSFVDNPYKGYADLPKIIQERNAEGAIFVREISPKMIRDIQQRGIPVVTIDHFPAVKQVNSLQIDNRRGGQLAAEHLIGLGHDRIGLLQAAQDRPSIRERVAGFREALSDHGIAFTTRSNVLQCDELDLESGYERIRRGFRRNRNLTALFCVNDEMAAGAIRAVRELGMAVPRDVSVVGFDDITMAGFFDPPLTTIGLVKEALGRRAMNRLLELVEGHDGKPRRETVPVELVVRRSTGRPPTRSGRKARG